ncbi:MAG: hypothetical protein Salg2KO_04270 [Salibacteraceae bacterium]
MNFVKTRIGDVADFVGGSQPPKSSFLDFEKEGYVRLIQIRDYKTDVFKTFIPSDSTRKFCTEKDVMIGRYGPPIFQILRGIEGAYNVALMKAIPKDNIRNDYLYYFLKQNTLFKYIDALSPRTGGQTGVDVPMLCDYPILLPELEYQDLVANLLTNIDSKIDLNNRINAELEGMAKLIYDYWFVQFDFPFDFAQGKPADDSSNPKDVKPYKSSGGKMVWNEELKREIPEGWDYGKFEDILDKIESGDRPKGGIDHDLKNGVPSIGAENILGIGTYKYGQEKFVPREYYVKMTSGKIVSGDVLMYKDGASLGRVSMFKNGFPYEECCINSHAFILRSNDRINQNYLYFHLDQDHIKEIIRRLGMRAAQPGINQVNVKSLPILIPSKKVNESFDLTIGSSVDKIFHNSKENQKLAELRDWLLPMLMNGQVRVKGAYEQGKEELGMVAEPRN